MAAKILWRDIVHKAFQALALESAIPIAIPSKTEWKHNATINKMLSPSEEAVVIPILMSFDSFPFLLPSVINNKKK